MRHDAKHDGSNGRWAELWRRAAPALVLVLLAPFVGEVLLGSIPTHLLYAYPALVPMYGGGALLVRELTRRSGRGGLTLLVLGAAYGVVEEGLGDMSLFNPNFLGLHLLEHGNLFGIGWVWWLDVLTLHVVWSIGVSVVLAEALFARRGAAPWLGRVGLVVAGVVLALGTALVHAAAGEGYALSTAQLVGSLGLILALVAVALLLPRPRRWPPPADDPRRVRQAPPPWLVGVAAFVPASAFMALDPRVSGALRLPALGTIVADVVLYLLVAITIARWSRRAGWGGTHRFALAAAAALTYTWCGLIFTGRDVLDLVGQVLVGLLAVGILAVAARRARSGDGLPAERRVGVDNHAPDEGGEDTRVADRAGGRVEQVAIEHGEVGELAGFDRAGLGVEAVGVGGADGGGVQRGGQVEPLGRQERLAGAVVGRDAGDRDLDQGERVGGGD